MSANKRVRDLDRRSKGTHRSVVSTAGAICNVTTWPSRDGKPVACIQRVPRDKNKG